MSAFVHSPNHIAAILVSAHPLGLESLTVDGITYEFFQHKDLETLAAILMAENVRSVNHRYAHHEEPETAEPVVLFRANRKPRLLTLAQLLMALVSLDYQSCETNNYQRTEAGMILEKMIRWAAVKTVGYAHPDALEMACKLPEYDKAGTWSID